MLLVEIVNKEIRVLDTELDISFTMLSLGKNSTKYRTMLQVTKDLKELEELVSSID